MTKKKSIFVAMALVMLATSCSTDDLQSGGALSNSQIGVHPTIGKVDTRASETTTANLSAFKTFSFLTDDSKNYMDGVTYSNASGEWTTDAGTFYWPLTGDLNFYSYAPENPGSEGEVTVNPSQQKMTGFVPYTTAATQQDLIYSKATGNLTNNGTSGIDLNFEHALSEITVSAKNDNTAYTVEVSGVKLGNITSKGDFTFPTIAGDAASWTLGEDKADYTTEWESATTLSSTVSSLDASNTAFMLIPQQLEAETKAKDGSYIALKVKITMQGGQVIHDGWAYVAVPTIWEMGKHYAYTLDFTSGAGQDENGNDIISGTDVTLKVNVTPWNEENIKLPRKYISGLNINQEPFPFLIDAKQISVKISDDGSWKYDVTEITPNSLEYAFAVEEMENVNFINFDLSSLNTKNVTNMEGMFYYSNDDYEQISALKKINMKGWDTSNVTNMNLMFDGCSSLTSLDVSHFDTHNVTNMNLMFGGCSSLTSLDLSNFDTSNVTSMNWMFSGCSSLTSLDLSNFDTSNVTSMNWMFYGCSSLETLDLSSFNTSNVTNMDSMFDGCSSLTSLDVSHFDTHNVTNMDSMFDGCSSLTSLDVSNFNTSKLTNLYWMFGGCSSLTSLDLSKFNIKFEGRQQINAMFCGCSSLKTLDLSGWKISNSVRVLSTDAGIFTPNFKGCDKLESIYMIGCDETTINKIKSSLIDSGLPTDIVKTTRE